MIKLDTLISNLRHAQRINRSASIGDGIFTPSECGVLANQIEIRTNTSEIPLPLKLFESKRGVVYWIVAQDGDKTVFNATRGYRPELTSGYYNLGALMKLKGDA